MTLQLAGTTDSRSAYTLSANAERLYNLLRWMQERATLRDIRGAAVVKPSRAWLAERLDVTVRTIGRLLAELRDAALILSRRTGRSSRYAVTAANEQHHQSPPRHPEQRVQKTAAPSPTNTEHVPSSSHRAAAVYRSEGAEGKTHDAADAPSRAGSVQTRKRPNVKRIEAADLDDEERREEIIRQAREKGLIGPGERHRLAVLALIERAKRIARHPVRFFAWHLWHFTDRNAARYIALEDEDRAHDRQRRERAAWYERTERRQVKAISPRPAPPPRSDAATAAALIDAALARGYTLPAARIAAKRALGWTAERFEAATTTRKENQQ